MRKVLLLIFLLPLLAKGQVIISQPQNFIKWIQVKDSTVLLNTLSAPDSSHNAITSAWAKRQFAPKISGGYVPNSRQIINGYGITGGHSLATDVTLATDTTHGSSGLLTWNYGLRFLTQANAISSYVSLSGSYANPSWITSLAWSKITGAPSSFPTPNALTFGYGFTGQPFTFDGSGAVTSKIDSAAIQTVGNFFTLGNTKYKLKSDSGNTANNYVTYGKFISGTSTLYNKTIQNTYTKIWDGTRGIKVGGSSLFGGGMIWDASVGTPNDTNFSLMTQSGSTTLNSTGNMYFSQLGTTYGELNNVGFSIDGVLEATSYPAGTAGTDRILVQGTTGGNFGSPIKSIAGNYYQQALGYTPQNTQANIIPEIAPATIPGTSYDMLPVILISKKGKTFVFFKRGTGHSVGGDLYLTTSTDNKTFSTPTLMLHSGSYNVNNISGFVTPTGRIAVFYTKQKTTTPFNSLGIDCIYSDDEFATNTTASVTSSALNATGSIAIGANNKILIPVYGGTTYGYAKVIASSDNFATFSSPIAINDTTAHTVNETGIAYLSGTTWISLSRTDPTSGNLYQHISSDDGATWTAVGSVDVGEVSPADISPFLTTYKDIDGRLMVQAFWSNRRSPGNISTATASALDLINNGVSAWVNGSFKVIVTTTADGNSGYPTFAHFNNSQYGIMAYYYGTSSILTNIKFAVWPAAGTPDVVYGDFNITGDFYKNGTKMPNGGVINWPGALYSTPTTATNVAGTLTFAPALATQTANTGLFGPTSGGAATPGFRAMVTADLPTLSTLTFGTHITGTSYNPATGAVTIATDAVTTNTNNTLVTRGSSGQFSMGALTALAGTFVATNKTLDLSPATTTGASYVRGHNDFGDLYYGINGLSGGAITGGAIKGQAVISIQAIAGQENHGLVLGTSATARDSISAIGKNFWLVTPSTAAGTYSIIVRDASTGEMQVSTALPSGTSAAGTFNLKSYTVATLPAGTQGDIAYVTDALAPTFLATVVGGGAIVCPVFYNGTNWVAQ